MSDTRVMDKNIEQRPMVSVGIIINELIKQGYPKDALKVRNHCLMIEDEHVSIVMAEIHKGEVSLDDVAQWFNINP